MPDSTTFSACGRTYRVHPACAAFPLLAGDEMAAFVASVREFGLIKPVMVDGDELLDGRIRLLACDLAGVEPRFVQWGEGRGGMSKAEWIVSVNLQRQHLTAAQRAALDVRNREWQRKTAECASPAEVEIAALLDIPIEYIRYAKEVAEADPDLAAEVLAGTITLTKAVAKVRRRQREAEDRER